MSTNATKRGVVGELLDHLLSEHRQLERRCAQLEVMLHDLVIPAVGGTRGYPRTERKRGYGDERR